MQNKILSLLSLAAKAGKVKSGDLQTEISVKKGEAILVIAAGDASLNTMKHFKDMCAYRKIPIYVYSVKEELGRHIGRNERAVIAVTDYGLGNRLISALEEEKK